MKDWHVFGFALGDLLSSEKVGIVVRCLILICICVPFVVFLSRRIRSFIAFKYSPQRGLIVGKAIHYIGFGMIIVSVFRELGFNLSPLLGAAGIVGIAIGFASQTSVSNIISGLFLITEEPFKVGDVIVVGEITGAVLSIDTLSVKLRTFDNKYVRIPNESIIKTNLVNVTHFPIRRLDIRLSVAYKEKISHVREVLKEIARKNPVCLEEPEPLIVFDGYGDSGINFLFAVWARKEKFLDLKNSIQEEIKERFDEEGIEIPFPHLSLYSGLATEPLPIRLIHSDGDDDAVDQNSNPFDALKKVESKPSQN